MTTFKKNRGFGFAVSLREALVRGCPLTGGLHLGDVLQQLLALVDDVEGQVVHGEGLVGVVLQPLLRQGQVLRVKLAHLLGQLLVP